MAVKVSSLYQELAIYLARGGQAYENFKVRKDGSGSHIAGNESHVIPSKVLSKSSDVVDAQMYSDGRVFATLTDMFGPSSDQF